MFSCKQLCKFPTQLTKPRSGATGWCNMKLLMFFANQLHITAMGGRRGQGAMDSVHVP